MNKILITISFIFLTALGISAQDDYNKFEVSGGYSFERVKGFPGDRSQSTSNFDGTTTSTYVTGENRTHNLSGFNASAVYNFSRYFGAKFEFSGNYGSDKDHTLPGGIYTQANGRTLLVIPGIGGIAAKQRDYKYLAGLQFKDNSKDKKLKPFAHTLFGAARQTTDFSNLDPQRTNLIGGKTIKVNGFSLAVGGGLDLRVSKRIDIRLIQFDYNPVFTKAKTLVPLGAQVDTLIPNLTAPGLVTSLQDFTIPKHTEQNYRVGFGIVIH